jgi:CRP-like cAMP-binding protein
VTVTIGANGLAMVLFSATAFSTQTYVSFAMSGANTQAASDTNASIAAGTSRQGAPILLTGLTAGSTTFKLKYRVASGTGTFLDRRIAVIPL